MAEAERCADALPEGVAGLPEPADIAARFETFVRAQPDRPGAAFLNVAVSYDLPPEKWTLGYADFASACSGVM